MDKSMVLKAIKYIKDECSVTSCDECDFCSKNGECILAMELGNSPCSIEIEYIVEHMRK